VKVFSGSSNKPLAEKIASELGVALSPTEIFIFPDGERRIQIPDKVVDEDVVVVQSTSPKPDTHYMELFFLVDAAKRSGASSITGVVPFLGYQRQDHVFREGEAVSLDVIIETLEAVGMDRLITFDLHSIKIPELFKIPITHLSALPIFAEKIKEIFPDYKDSVLVSPDMGGIRRIKLISEFLGNIPYVAIIKDRDLATGNISVSQFDNKDFQKDVKRAIIVDDMISTGRTIVAAAELLRKHGIEESFVFATHPVFSKDAAKILQSSKIGKVFVTDSIDIPEEKRFDNLEILSIAQETSENLK
jgi:ribose-phosphate pyrophosphokinase